MSFVTEVKEKYTYIKIEEKRATLASAQDFKKFIADLVLGGTNFMMLDLSNVEFIDSTFLGGLVLAHKKAVELKGAVCYTGLQKSVKATFEITMLDKKLTIFETPEEGDNYLNSL